MYALIDTFNDKILSRHRTLRGAAKAEAKHSRQVERANGAGSYVPKVIKRIGEGGVLLGLDDREQDELLGCQNELC